MTLFEVEIILYEEYCYQLSLQDGDMTMEYLSIRQVAEKWGLSARRINVLCSEGNIEGATKINKNRFLLGCASGCRETKG